MISVKRLLSGAVSGGNWLVNNQICDTLDANCGRFAAEVIVPEKRVSEWSTNWTTGMGILSLVLLHKHTGDGKWLAAALRAAKYLESLQVLGTRDARINGLFREIMPQTDWCHPRDALTAAWGLLQLGQHTGNQEYIERALIFADWFLKFAMHENYPAWTCYTDQRPPYLMLGSFHGGSPLFFMDLFALTGQRKWLDKAALPILKRYLEIFAKSDGSIDVVIDPQTGKSPLRRKEWRNVQAWAYMHKINDDFTALAMLRAFRVTGNKLYLKAASKFLAWVMTQQNSDGSFGTPTVPSGTASLILELADMAEITGEQNYTDAALRAAEFLLSSQQRACRAPLCRGGFYGMHGLNGTRLNYALHIRTTTYAIAGLLRLKGGCTNSILTALV